jgi:hypothetical protein
LLGVDHKTVVNDRKPGENSPATDNAQARAEHYDGEFSPLPPTVAGAIAELPEDEQPRLAALVNQPAIPESYALGMVENAAALAPAGRPASTTEEGRHQTPQC